MAKAYKINHCKYCGTVINPYIEFCSHQCKVDYLEDQGYNDRVRTATTNPFTEVPNEPNS